ncbi:MAG: hypothetical protein OMM_07216 [Candidatus Magnetoglobus multicellularis str. Araruama]|uniref:Uncharacterized protein n=1 Tax=Candidatus Magnetoglobus multicellularis str. Araruama TaxID=890399 RepID=A0A1V1PDP8_9BACT|nr:MAG: hypothetical protein OMM_07216 [Candidatus Magnetoglobus multicellularis str. Araruama]
MLSLIFSTISGILILNAVPHIVKGICGEKHMSPFGQKSSAWINVVWGWANLICGAIIAINLDFPNWTTDLWLGFCAGGMGTSVGLAIFWSDPNARLPWHKQENVR